MCKNNRLLALALHLYLEVSLPAKESLRKREWPSESVLLEQELEIEEELELELEVELELELELE